MKTIILIVLCCCFVIHNNAQNQWVVTNIPSNYSLIDFDFINPNTGWAIVRNPSNNTDAYLYKTSNKCNTWSTNPIWSNNPGYGTWYSIDFIDNNLGFICYGDKILKTNDVNVTIKIYDILGREVAQLLNNEFKKAGSYETILNANNFASGVYFYRIEARQVGSLIGSFVDSKKMVLIK